MKALITGGAGFIGSHLAEALLACEREVVALDDLSTGSLQNILHLMRRPGFEFALGSIMDEEAVDRAVAACDVVFHLGAAVGVRLVFEQPVRTIETNVKGTQHILDACLRHGRKALIASGDDSQVRSFQWVGDAVEAIIRLMETRAAEGDVFNVGSEEAITIGNLAERVRLMTGSSSETVFVPYEEAYGPGFEDIKYRVPDINKLRKLTGYAPTLSIDEILERVIEYTRPRLSSRAPQGRGDLSVTPSSRA